MKMRTPECVVLQHQGAKYVSQLLANKTKQEQLEFWRKRTEALLLLQSQGQVHSDNTKS
jgi:hypothetical protein